VSAALAAFDDRTMADPLIQQLSKKKMKRRRTPNADCDDLHLLIAYDQALPYCSPIETPHRRVSETAREAAASLAADRGPFSRAFLFVAVEPGFRVHRLL